MAQFLIVVETYVDIHDVIMRIDSDHTMLFDAYDHDIVYASEHLGLDCKVVEW